MDPAHDSIAAVIRELSLPADAIDEQEAKVLSMLEELIPDPKQREDFRFEMVYLTHLRAVSVFKCGQSYSAKPFLVKDEKYTPLAQQEGK